MKKIALVFLCIIMAASFVACDDVESALSGLEDAVSGVESALGLNDHEEDSPYAYENDAQKIAEDTTYYNTFLGVTYTAPSGWWIYEINGENFSETASETANATGLDIYSQDGYEFIKMASIANLQFSSKSNHMGVDISAEKIEGIETIEDYMESHIEYMLEPYGGETYSLVEVDEVDINGTLFQTSVVEVTRDDDEDYRIISFICEVNDGYFLTVSANYWVTNSKAIETATDILKDALKIG